MTRNPNRISDRQNLVFTDQHPVDLLAGLERDGFSEAVLAGGSHINALFARQGLIDEIHLTYVPKIFGTGLSLFADPVEMDLALMSCEKMGTDQILARYRVRSLATGYSESS
jgi:dihydrofolate reductase